MPQMYLLVSKSVLRTGWQLVLHRRDQYGVLLKAKQHQKLGGKTHTTPLRVNAIPCIKPWSNSVRRVEASWQMVVWAICASEKACDHRCLHRARWRRKDTESNTIYGSLLIMYVFSRGRLTGHHSEHRQKITRKLGTKNWQQLPTTTTTTTTLTVSYCRDNLMLSLRNFFLMPLKNYPQFHSNFAAY